MELVESGKLRKKSSLFQKLEKYLPFLRCAMPKTKAMLRNNSARETLMKKDYKLMKKSRVVPNGYFSVYVGSEQQRFVIKTEFANHPSFKMLLEDAESEYGFEIEGPLLLPCGVDLFWKVLAQILDGDNTEEFDKTGFARGLCSPIINSVRRFNKIGTSYPIAVSRA